MDDELRADSSQYLVTLPIFAVVSHVRRDSTTGRIVLDSDTELAAPSPNATPESMLALFTDSPAAEIYRDNCDAYREFTILGLDAIDSIRLLDAVAGIVQSVILDPRPSDGRGAIITLTELRKQIVLMLDSQHDA
jgi:hypothetical protein